MEPQNQSTRRHGLTAIDGALALIIILLIIQMWLLTATLDSYLAGHSDVVLSAAIVSGILFLACAGLQVFVQRIDADARKTSLKENRDLL
ncbi:MAG: DUF6755 family protein [Limisphaerales bacterium]